MASSSCFRPTPPPFSRSSRFRSLRPPPPLLPPNSPRPLHPPITTPSGGGVLASLRAVLSNGPSDPDRMGGVSVYKPKSYEVLVSDAARSLVYALEDGKTRLEIDFPPLPSDISSYKGSSDEFIDANIQLALAVVRKLQEMKGTRSCIVFPDQPEKRRASQLFRTALDTIGGVNIGSLDDIPSGPVTSFFKSIRSTLDFDFADDDEGRWKLDEPPSLYVFINCSTRELSAIEKYVGLGRLCLNRLMVPLLA